MNQIEKALAAIRAAVAAFCEKRPTCDDLRQQREQAEHKLLQARQLSRELAQYSQAIQKTLPIHAVPRVESVDGGTVITVPFHLDTGRRWEACYSFGSSLEIQMEVDRCHLCGASEPAPSAQIRPVFTRPSLAGPETVKLCAGCLSSIVSP